MNEKILKILTEMQEEQTQLKTQLASLQIAFKGNSEEFLTTKELERVMKSGRTKIDDLRATGLLKSYKVKGKLLFKKSEVVKLIESMEVRPQRA